MPSEEVIDKLSKAYGIKPKALRNRPKKQFPRFFHNLVMPLLGIFLIISGSNAMLFSSTYYTYKTEPIAPIDEAELYLNYHLSDTYMGEKFISEKSSTKYHFTLIASREIERKENKLQTILGLALLLISLGLNFNRLQLLLKRFQNKDIAEK